MDLALLLAGLRTGTLKAEALTPEQVALLTGITPEALVDLDAESVAAAAAAIRALGRAEKAAGAEKVSPAIARALVAVVKDQDRRSAETADQDAAEALLDPEEKKDGGDGGAAPEGGEKTEEKVLVSADGTELPPVNPSGNAPAGGGAVTAAWTPADPYAMPFQGVVATIATPDGKIQAGNPITNEQFMREMARTYQGVVAGMGSGPMAQQVVGTIEKYNLAPNDPRRLSERNTAWQNQHLIDGAVAEGAQMVRTVKRPTGVAAAVWCGPVGVSFDIAVAGRGGRPIYDSLPKTPATRGQFKFRPDLAVARTPASPPWVDWNPDTNTPDCAAWTCVTPSCETTEQLVQLNFYRACFTHTGTHELTDPEGLAAVTRKNMIQLDRWLEQKYMAQLQLFALTSGHYFEWDNETTYGAVPDAVNLLFGATSEIGWDGRYETGNYVAYIPMGLEDWMFVDEISSAYQTSGAAQFREALTRRGISIVEYMDDPVLGRNPLAGPVYNQPAGGNLTTTTTSTSATTNGSAVVTGLTSSAYRYVGQSVTGTGIPASTTIASVDSVTQVTLSANATATGTPTLTFYGDYTAQQPKLIRDPVGKSTAPFRIFLVPKGGVLVAETGSVEIGPDRVTQAKCDIIQTVMTLREAMYRKDPNRPVFSIDVSLKFNGARAGAVTPWT